MYLLMIGESESCHDIHGSQTARMKTDGNNMKPVNDITQAIIGAAIEVHKALGPGLLESAYEECLARELTLKGIPFERQHPLPIEYKGLQLDCGYRIDLLVENRVVVELKAIEGLLPLHEAQILTYLKLGGWSTGLLINFNVPVLTKGIRRLVCGPKEP
jgi:GxxExxY protein